VVGWFPKLWVALATADRLDVVEVVARLGPHDPGLHTLAVR
jgi:hypothetical protein